MPFMINMREVPSFSRSQDMEEVAKLQKPHTHKHGIVRICEQVDVSESLTCVSTIRRASV